MLLYKFEIVTLLVVLSWEHRSISQLKSFQITRVNIIKKKENMGRKKWLENKLEENWNYKREKNSK